MTNVGVHKALEVVRDILRDNLTDYYVVAGGKSRTWIHTDLPRLDARFPRITIRKISNPLDIISICGNDFWEYEQCFMNVLFFTKHDFRVTISGTEYKNESLVEYALNDIKRTIKSNLATFDANAMTGYKPTATSQVIYDSDIQVHVASVTIRCGWFNNP